MVAPHELHSPVCESTCFDSKYSIGSHSPKHLLESYGYRGRVAQLGEHLLCKHVFISPKSLNRRLLTVQNPLLVGLLIGLHNIKVLVQAWPNTTENGLDSSRSVPENTAARTLERVSGSFHLVPVPAENVIQGEHL